MTGAGPAENAQSLRLAHAHRSSGAAKRRSLWWRVHAWAGLKLSLLLAVILFTGTLATVSNEIDWLLRPPMRATSTDAPPASFGTMLGRAQTALSRDERIDRLILPEDSWQNARALVRGPGDQRRFIYLDRATGDVAGEGSWITIQRVLRDMHRRLFIPTDWGIRIVSAFAILLLVSLVTGLVTYKRFWRGLFRRPRTQAETALVHDRRFMGDLHRLLGLWSIPLLVVISLTGLWYLVEASGGAAPKPRAEQEARAQLAARAEPAAAPAGPVSPDLLDQMVAEAKAQIPGLDVREVHLPGMSDQPVAVMGQASASLVRNRANAVWFDPASGEPLAAVRGEALNAHQRIAEAADPLHFGTFGGLATRILYFLLGLALTFLAVSGALVHALRLAAADREAYPALAPRILAGMGAWRYLSVAGLVIALVLAPLSLSGRL